MAQSVLGSEEIRRAAYEAAAASCVLLKNDNSLLPLSSGARPHLDGECYFNRYIDESSDPLYPFGFGLSYTNFVLESTVVSSTLSASSSAKLRTKVMNTGNYRGAAIIQVYARVRKSPLIRPMRQLIAWKRIELLPGASAEIEFEVTPDMLMLYDAQGQGYEPEGICDLAVGMDADAPFTFCVFCEK